MNKRGVHQGLPRCKEIQDGCSFFQGDGVLGDEALARVESSLKKNTKDPE